MLFCRRKFYICIKCHRQGKLITKTIVFLRPWIKVHCRSQKVIAFFGHIISKGRLTFIGTACKWGENTIEKDLYYFFISYFSLCFFLYFFLIPRDFWKIRPCCFVSLTKIHTWWFNLQHLIGSKAFIPRRECRQLHFRRELFEGISVWNPSGKQKN